MAAGGRYQPTRAPADELHRLLADCETTSPEAVGAEDGLLIRNPHWDTVTDGEQWYEDVSDFYQKQDFTYSDEYNILFEHQHYFQRLRLCTVRGCVHTNRFHSLMWKLFLEVLPEERMLWYGAMQDYRSHYLELKKTVIVKPPSYALKESSDNSCSVDSPWSQYIKDKAVRGLIKRDIERLNFHDCDEAQALNAFFSDKQIEKMMKDILFCCAKENDRIGYYQGMHDILAVIMWVVHCDQLAFQTADESASSLGKTVSQLFSMEHLESDSYMILFQLMQPLSSWCAYDVNSSTGVPLNECASEKSPTGVRVSRRLSNAQTPLSKLMHIHSRLVKHFSKELYCHFKSFDVYPPVFGFRWLLVLFVRDLRHMHDIRLLWSGIFADGLDLDLVDYVFVAILLFLKNKLLRCSLEECFDILLRELPPDFDVQRFVRDARLLRNQFLNDALLKSLCWENITMSEVLSSEVKPPAAAANLDVVDGVIPDIFGAAKQRIKRIKESSSPGTWNIASADKPKKRVSTNDPGKTSGHHLLLPIPLDRDPLEVQKELAEVSQKLSALEYSCNLSCRGVDFWTGMLQHRIATGLLQMDDIKAAVCGLKEVSFRLRSALSRSSFFHLLELEEAQTDFRNIQVNEFPLTQGLFKMSMQVDDALRTRCSSSESIDA